MYGREMMLFREHMRKMHFEKHFSKFHRNKVLHVGRIITCVGIGQGLIVWIAALWKGAGGPGTEAEGGSAIKLTMYCDA